MRALPAEALRFIIFLSSMSISDFLQSKVKPERCRDNWADGNLWKTK
jgi:hypothetical protein